MWDPLLAISNFSKSTAQIIVKTVETCFNLVNFDSYEFVTALRLSVVSSSAYYLLGMVPIRKVYHISQGSSFSNVTFLGKKYHHFTKIAFYGTSGFSFLQELCSLISFLLLQIISTLYKVYIGTIYFEFYHREGSWDYLLVTQ